MQACAGQALLDRLAHCPPPPGDVAERERKESFQKARVCQDWSQSCHPRLPALLSTVHCVCRSDGGRGLGGEREAG